VAKHHERNSRQQADLNHVLSHPPSALPGIRVFS
jgi:hypothetical protein